VSPNDSPWLGGGINDPIAVVAAWHDAVNAGDATRLAAVLDEDIELLGPRGASTGRATVIDWLARAGITLDPRRIFGREGRVVVEQQAIWRDPETGQSGEPQTVASTFLVDADTGRVRHIARYPDLTTALAAADLDASDEIRS
jgi:hypothetical protein